MDLRKESMGSRFNFRETWGGDTKMTSASEGRFIAAQNAAFELLLSGVPRHQAAQPMLEVARTQTGPNSRVALWVAEDGGLGQIGLCATAGCSEDDCKALRSLEQDLRNVFPCEQSCWAEDVESDVRWRPHARFAQTQHIRTCCSVPVLSPARSTMGLLTVFFQAQQKAKGIEALETLAGTLWVILECHRQLDAERKARRVLQDHANELENVMDAVPAAIWIARDPECRTIVGNRAASILLEVNGSENVAAKSSLPDIRLLSSEGKELRPEDLPMERAAATNREVRDAELMVMLPSGKRAHIVGSALPLRDERGAVRGCVGAFIDITERKQAEDTLRRNEQWLNLCLDAADLGTWAWDPQTDIVAFDPRLARMFGLTGHQVSVEWLLTHLIHPEDRAGLKKVLEEVLAAGLDGRYHAEYRICLSDGSIRWVQGDGHVIKYKHTLQLVGTALEITERKQFQAELERLVSDRTARLEEVVAELEHISYSIIHDMRSPLRAMRGFAHIIEEICPHEPKSEVQVYLDRIHCAAERMDLLITDALQYTKAVRHELPTVPVELEPLLQGIIQTYPELLPEHTQIQVEKGLPAVLGNRAGLTQCFSNLLGNAAKFGKPGQTPNIHIWAELRNDWVRIWVEDDGIGIPGSVLPRVFNMFVRGGAGPVGTGIGLALVRKVIQRMGGKVGVESEEGKGSRFWIELKGAVDEQPPGKAAWVRPTAKANAKTVFLYVEDEENDVLFMRLAFDKKSAETAILQVVPDGQAAVEYLSGIGKFAERVAFPVPAVVLLDLNLPKMTGYEVLQWMRQNPNFARTPVVIFSSSNREEDRARAMALGANGFVVKPKSGMDFAKALEGLPGLS